VVDRRYSSRIQASAFSGAAGVLAVRLPARSPGRVLTRAGSLRTLAAPMRKLAALLALALVAAPLAAAKDRKPPSVPRQLTAKPVSASQVALSWKASKDNVGVAGYRVYRDGSQVATTPGTSYAAGGLSASTSYSFAVAAYDRAGNVSGRSAPAGATTLDGSGPPQEPLVQPSDLVYEGAFLLPESDPGFSYGGTALAYDPGRNGLFAVGHDWYQLTAEVSIPPLVDSTDLSALNTATLLQPFADATGGKIDEAGPDTNKIGGELVYQGRLYGTVYVYYDASGSQVVTHWARNGTSLSSGAASGLYAVGDAGAGFVSGYLAEVPPEWQASLGGPALTGNCCIPIISRTSYGPGVSVFDPAQLGSADPVPATPLVDYPSDHPALGDWGESWNPAEGILWDGATTIRGVVFPKGTSSVLFFGTQGIGPFCYGEGTDDQSLAGQPTPDGSVWCYDPDDSSKGTHGYPYVPEVWAYDANDLLAVRTGAKQPWEVKPYATWQLDLPFGSPTIGGAAYDPGTGTIYVSQQFGNGTDPVIHAFRVQ
jgi:hypothetical protein